MGGRRVTVRIEDGVQVQCPCGETAILGFATGVGPERVPTVLHSGAPCEKFRTLEVDEYATYLRKSYQN